MMHSANTLQHTVASALHPKQAFVLAVAAIAVCRWGNPEFGKYVQQLQQHVDDALGLTPEHTAAAKAVVEKVADLEVAFWSMAYN